MATNISDLLKSSDTLQEGQGQTFESAFGVTPKSTTDVIDFEGDSFTNRLGRSFNESQKSFFEGLDVLGKKFGMEGLSEYSKLKAAEQELDIASYGMPTRTASLTQGMDEISKTYADKGLGESIYRGLLLAKDMTADALGSLALPVTAGLAAIPIGAVSSGAGAITAIAAPFLVSMPMGTGQIYEEAKKIGADEEKAQNYAIGGGTVVGLLDKIGAGSVIKGLVGSYGKEAVVKEFSKELGESVAKRVVDGALNFSKGVAVGGTKSALTEAATEAGQEAVQMLSAGYAAGYEGFPYETAVTQQRLLDAAALGFVGGKVAGTMADFAQNRTDRLVAERAEELKQNPEEVAKYIANSDAEISTLYTAEQGKTKDEKVKESITIADRTVKSAVSALNELATRSDGGAKIVNSLGNYYNASSAAIGKDADSVFPVFEELKRNIKLPFQRAISKKAMQSLFFEMAQDIKSADPKINKAAQDLRTKVFGTVELDPKTGQPRKAVKLDSNSLMEAIVTGQPISEVQQLLNDGLITSREVNVINNFIGPLQKNYSDRMAASPNEEAAIRNSIKNSDEFKNIVGSTLYTPEATGLYKKMLDSGIDIDFQQGYLPVVYKTGLLDRRKMMRILMGSDNPTSGRKFTKGEALRIVDNIAGNEGFYKPTQTSLDLGPKSPSGKQFPKEESFQMARTIPEEVRKKFEKAGLTETNVEALTYRYIFDANRRLEAEKLKNVIEPEVKKLAASGDISDAEINYIRDLYSAIQNQYKPISNPTLQKIQRWVLTGNYILTLPLAGIAALTEPIIILSRVSPKYALFGLMDASVNALKNGLRSVFPKISLGEKEKAFKGILQGLDGAMAERFGDIANVSVSRKITNAFFKTTLLTQITQFSRDMAFQASRRQMTDDIKTVNLVETPKPDGSKKKPTKEYVNAKKRLLEQGIVNPQSSIMQDWAAGKLVSDPDAIRQSLSKTVDEFIMSPNAVNRPLWMSNPWLASVAQLKGFMIVFGNTVGGRIYREVFTPLLKGRMPADEIFRYAMTFTLLLGATMYIKALRDFIRYGDEESPFDQMEGKDKFVEALLSTNIFGAGTIVWDALNAQRFGSDFWSSLLGPTASRISSLAKGTSQYLSDNPRTLAREIANLVPVLTNIPSVRPVKDEIVSAIEDNLQEAKDSLTSIFD